MTSRTSWLLTLALLFSTFLLGAHQLSTADAPVSPTASVDTMEGSSAVQAAGSDLAGVTVTPTSGRDDDAADLLDLYGNEVTAAVAQYKLDSTGSLYELHSPQTELPRLAAAKS